MPPERNQTIRQVIIALLEQEPMTVRDLSQLVGITEKDVYFHLAFIARTVKQQKKRIHVVPYHCLSCGFEFKNRKSFKKPGKCPGCREGRIAPAVYAIKSK
jgi:predicted Zn-ribbon and HTH transcriptional regulator